MGGGAGREEDYTVAVTIRGRQRGGGCRVSGVGGGTRREVVYSGSCNKTKTKRRRMEMIWTGQRGRKRSRLHSGSNKRKTKRRREIIWSGRKNRRSGNLQGTQQQSVVAAALRSTNYRLHTGCMTAGMYLYCTK